MTSLQELISREPESVVLVEYLHKNGAWTGLQILAKDLLCDHDEYYFGEVEPIRDQEYQYRVTYFAGQKREDEEEEEGGW